MPRIMDITSTQDRASRWESAVKNHKLISGAFLYLSHHLTVSCIELTINMVGGVFKSVIIHDHHKT